jgi:hypothetical protein
LLSHDVLLRTQQGDVNGAALSCWAILNTARSIGDEPTMLPLLIRLACRGIGQRQLERVLAQGQLPPDLLAGLQTVLEEEEAYPSLLVAMRGERAQADRLASELQSGSVKLSQLGPSGTQAGNPSGAVDLERVFSPLFYGPMARTHGALLRYLTDVVAIAKQPVEDQRRLLQPLKSGRSQQPVLVSLLIPAVDKTAEAYLRCQADIRCAQVMLATERYRLRHHRWPAGLDDLVAEKLLKHVPIDPYDGAPLRFLRVEDGVIVYSIGPDGKDDGGKINRQNPNLAGSDVGYQLWDVAKRRQAPPRSEPGKP